MVDLPELELKVVVSHLMGVLEIELGSSVWAVSAFDHWAISSDPRAWVWIPRSFSWCADSGSVTPWGQAATLCEPQQEHLIAMKELSGSGHCFPWRAHLWVLKVLFMWGNQTCQPSCAPVVRLVVVPSEGNPSFFPTSPPPLPTIKLPSWLVYFLSLS